MEIGERSELQDGNWRAKRATSIETSRAKRVITDRITKNHQENEGKGERSELHELEYKHHSTRYYRSNHEKSPREWRKRRAKRAKTKNRSASEANCINWNTSNHSRAKRVSDCVNNKIFASKTISSREIGEPIELLTFCTKAWIRHTASKSLFTEG